MLVNLSYAKGLSLTELLISMSIGLIALASLASVIGFGVGTNGRLMESATLNEELGATMFLMTREIRRAGFNGNTVALVTDPNANPSLFQNTLLISQFPGEAANSCILFAYDENLNGSLDGGPRAEAVGFRLRDEILEMRVNGTSCDAPGWDPLTNKNSVVVSELQFSNTQVIDSGVTANLVGVNLAGSRTDKPTLSRRFSTTIWVRNYD